MEVVCTHLHQGFSLWHLGSGNSGLWGAFLCFMVCLALSLAPAHWIPVTPYSPSSDNQKCLHTSSKMPLKGKTAPGWGPLTSLTLRVLHSLTLPQGWIHVQGEGAVLNKTAIRKSGGSQVIHGSTNKGPGPACRSTHEQRRPRSTAKWGKPQGHSEAEAMPCTLAGSLLRTGHQTEGSKWMLTINLRSVFSKLFLIGFGVVFCLFFLK